MNIAIGGAGLIRRQAKGDGKLNRAGAKGDFASGDGGVDYFLIVKPRGDFPGRDGDLDVMPMAGVERDALAGFVFGGVQIVEAGKADSRSAPAAENQAAKGIADGKSQPAKEIVALGFHGVERDFVIGFGQRAVGPIDAGHDAADGEMDFIGHNRDLAAGDKIAVGPVVKVAAVEKRGPVGGPGVRRSLGRSANCSQRQNSQRQGGEPESERFHGSNSSGTRSKFNIM